MSGKLSDRTERMIGYPCLLVGLIVALLKLTGMVGWSWLWLCLGLSAFALLCGVVGVIIYVSRAVLELSGFLKPNVEGWVKNRIDRWLEEHSDSVDDLRPEIKIANEELNRMEKSIRQEAIESHRRQNWTTVKVFASLAILIVVLRGLSASK